MRRATLNKKIIDKLGVSIHARHATGDFNIFKSFIYDKFQFTPAMRRATTTKTNKPTLDIVSIHARHATGDFLQIGQKKE